MPQLTLSEIYIYPIKSLGGISVTSAPAEERGLKYDRRFLLVDENNMFMTQRDFPEMALLKLSFYENGFKVLNTKDGSHIVLPFKSDSNENISVKIWEDICGAVRVSQDVDVWFSTAIDKKCSLVYMSDDEKRIVEKKYLNENHIVSFADAYPYLIIGQSSLDDLNTKLEKPLPMNRFRPNFVFTGGTPYEEDNWKDFRINNVDFMAVKPCARCVITTTNQDTAERTAEPLKTLSLYRKINTKVMFGMNVICKNNGTVSVGDRIFLY
ncbi:MAG: MOSC domain-containing protein [Ignavibacterium sp.]|nr:MOSC domain-containing protein [Ignavibacterium sp.]HCY76814.1 MOSC domain-containing protein [Ignavibacteriales bacterium]